MKTLVAFYDLAVGPTSFDFVVFGVQAELERRGSGADRLHFVFVPDAKHYTRPKPAIYSQEEAVWRLHQICLPACALLGASFSLEPDRETIDVVGPKYRWPEDWDRQTLKNRHHLVGGVIRAAKAGERIPTLSASAFARKKVRDLFARIGLPIVTMTKRKTYLGGRNSDDSTWAAAARYISASGCYPWILEDTNVALTEGSGFGEINLDLRMAILQEADFNLQANNGAASLCWFSEKPYRMFGAGDEHWHGLFVEQGLPLGESWPWARAQQKLCYGKETLGSIIAEFDSWRKFRGLR